MYSPVTTFCPRCGTRSLIVLTTHSFCAECNYSPDTEIVDLHTRDVEGERIYDLDERARSGDDLEDLDSEDEEDEEYRLFNWRFELGDNYEYDLPDFSREADDEY